MLKHKRLPDTISSFEPKSAKSSNIPEIMKIMCWALRRLLVHLLYRVTSANISLWVWNGIQQKKKEKTTTARRMVVIFMYQEYTNLSRILYSRYTPKCVGPGCAGVVH